MVGVSGRVFWTRTQCCRGSVFRASWVCSPSRLWAICPPPLTLCWPLDGLWVLAWELPSLDQCDEVMWPLEQLLVSESAHLYNHFKVACSVRLCAGHW